MSHVRILAGGLLAISCLAPAGAAALDQEYVPEEVVIEEPAHPDGWTHTFDLGAAIQIAGSHQVVGQPDGATVTLSLSLAYAGELWAGNHEFHATASLVEAISRTPLVDDFVKSSDQLRGELIWYYHLPSAPWFGPFARASARTSLFQGVDVQPDEVTYLRDGETIVADRLQLTESFAPTYLKQSIGVFARPTESERLTVDFRLGLGAREVIADGNYVINDDDATDEIEVDPLHTYAQTGGEFAATLDGSADGGRVNYGAFYEMLVPFYDSLDDDLDPVAAINYEMGATFGASLSSWASVQYELGLLKVPQVVDDWQITNMLLLSFNYGITRGVGAE